MLFIVSAVGFNKHLLPPFAVRANDIQTATMLAKDVAECLNDGKDCRIELRCSEVLPLYFVSKDGGIYASY